jgi:hypothetical protein
MSNVEQAIAAIRDGLAGCLESDAGHHLPGKEILALGELLSIDLVEQWKSDQKTKTGAAFFELFTKDQLADLGKELGVEVNGSLPKSEIVGLFTSAKKTLAMPKLLKTAKVER